MVVLQFILAAALAAAASIPTPYVLFEIIRYSTTKLPLWGRAHCYHRLRPLNTLLLALTPSN